MSTPKGYTTKQEIQNYLMQTIDSSFNSQIDNWICAAEKYIEQFTSRVFIADLSASARLFDGLNGEAILIDDCVAITKVEVGNDRYGESFAEIPASGAGRYIKLPNNNESQGVPIRKILLTAGVWSEGIQNHRITAKWGYSVAVPDDIKWAATILASGICIPGITGNIGGIKSEKIGEYSVSYNTESQQVDYDKAVEILKSYQKINI